MQLYISLLTRIYGYCKMEDDMKMRLSGSVTKEIGTTVVYDYVP